MLWINYVVGYSLIIYAVLKAIVCILDLIPPKYFPFKIPFLTHDTSVAGLVLVISFLIFAVYTFLHGLGILHILSPTLNSLFTNYFTSYVVYMILTIILTVFYSLVLFTNLPISKNIEHKSSYEIIGLCGGISFFCSILILEVYRNIINKKRSALIIILLPCIFIFILIIVIITYNSLYNKNNHETSIYDILSIMAIPFVAIS